jgi:hypothetical protein
MRDPGYGIRDTGYESRDMRFAVRDPGFKARISYLVTRIPDPELQVAPVSLVPPASPISSESGIAFRDSSAVAFCHSMLLLIVV